FDLVFVINLSSRSDRLRDMERQLGLIGLSLGEGQVRRFDAVRPTSAGDWPSVGARGCYFSHLGAIQAACSEGADSVLILEDDADWTSSFLGSNSAELDLLRNAEWDFLYGGVASKQKLGRSPVLVSIAPEQQVVTAHMVGLRGAALEGAVPYLDELAGRPAGSPDGGPMHVDGAYNWFRRSNLSVRSMIFEPAAALQRSSTSNISSNKWDSLPFIRRFYDFARKFFKHGI
ncbi:MAG: glycosyltransferase family 25 protein, partial [Pseudomonadota bacterium]